LIDLDWDERQRMAGERGMESWSDGVAAEKPKLGKKRSGNRFCALSSSGPSAIRGNNPTQRRHGAARQAATKAVSLN